MTATMQDELDRMLTRLKLTAVRDQLDSLLDEAARSEPTLRDALAFFCAREIARKNQRCIDMSFGLAKFPFVRTLDGFDFTAQPSIDKAQVRDRAARGSLPHQGARSHRRRGRHSGYGTL